jgi:hypothetical protein
MHREQERALGGRHRDQVRIEALDLRDEVVHRIGVLVQSIRARLVGPRHQEVGQRPLGALATYLDVIVGVDVVIRGVEQVDRDAAVFQEARKDRNRGRHEALGPLIRIEEEHPEIRRHHALQILIGTKQEMAGMARWPPLR